jgi:hypothetical protein
MSHAKNLSRWIRQITGWWEARRRRAQRYKAMPFMRDLDRQEAEYRRSHRRGAARIVRAKRDAMTRALAGRM